MGRPYKPMNHIGLIYSGYISLSLRWYFIWRQYFLLVGFVILDILTFFKALMSNIFANYVSPLKKTWLTTVLFEQRSLKEKNLQSERSTIWASLPAKRVFKDNSIFWIKLITWSLEILFSLSQPLMNSEAPKSKLVWISDSLGCLCLIVKKRPKSELA